MSTASPDAITLNSPQVVTGRWTLAEQQLRVNGVVRASGAPSVSPTSLGFSLGAAQYASNQSDFWQGRIHTVLVIKGTVSDADLLVLEKFVAQLSGVTI